VVPDPSRAEFRSRQNEYGAEGSLASAPWCRPFARALGVLARWRDSPAQLTA
jgi:hypothetical protein